MPSVSDAVMRSVSAARAGARSGRPGGGDFEKCAADSAAWLIPILGAGLGAGVGYFSDKRRPLDEDEDAGKRRRNAILFGAAAGGLGGMGLSALTSLISPGSFDSDGKKSVLGKFDPSLRHTTEAALALNTLPGWSRLHRMFPSLDSARRGSTAGYSVTPGSSTGMKFWDRLFSDKKLALNFDDAPLFSATSSPTISHLIDEVYRTKGSVSSKAKLYKEISNTLAGGRTATPSSPFYFNTALSEADAVRAIERAHGQNLYKALRFNQRLAENAGKKGFGNRVWRGIRSGTGRTLSGLLALSMIADDLGMVNEAGRNR